MGFEVFITPSLVVLFYIFAEIAKKTFLKTDEKRKLIPVICASIGVVVGILLFFFSPETLGVSGLLDSIATCAVSALAATGCNQLYKQISKFTGQEPSSSDNSSDEEL